MNENFSLTKYTFVIFYYLLFVNKRSIKTNQSNVENRFTFCIDKIERHHEIIKHFIEVSTRYQQQRF